MSSKYEDDIVNRSFYNLCVDSWINNRLQRCDKYDSDIDVKSLMMAVLKMSDPVMPAPIILKEEGSYDTSSKVCLQSESFFRHSISCALTCKM